MKNILSLILFSLITAGCTSNLIISDYKTESEYYRDLAEISEDRKVRIETNDSSFTLQEMVVNKDSVKGKIISFDSDYYFSAPKKIVKEFALPTDDVKSFSITKRTHSIAKGAAMGFFVGAFYGYAFLQFGGVSNSGYHVDYVFPGIIGAATGLIIGGIIGSIVGEDFVFSSDTKLDRGELFSDNSVHKLGLKFGYHEGYNISSIPQEGHSAGGIDGESVPGFMATMYYNIAIGKNFSINNELSYISAGSEEKYSMYIMQPDFSRDIYTGQGIENIKVLEASPLIRLNLAKEGFTPYFIFGPKFCFQFPPENSSKEKFYSDINKHYDSNDIRLSGVYKKFYWSGVLGFGFSTGKLAPYEILIELKYCKDLSARFQVDYYNKYPGLGFYDGQSYWIDKHQAEEIILSAGVAIF